MSKEDAIKKLKSLTNKNHIYFFNSGDEGIFYLMNLMKENNKTKILIPDCGGWFSYKKFPKKLNLEIIEIKTKDAVIDLDDLKLKADETSFFIINSYGGYFVEQPMNEIEIICKENNCILINDVSASINSEYAKQGELCVGSFGHQKPIELNLGGFIGSNKELIVEEDFNEFEKLNSALDILDEKLNYWRDEKKKIINDLGEYDILHKNSNAINLVVAFETEQEKENLINYCVKNNLEYVLCPNYIKVNRQAISIEIKKIPFKAN